MASGTGKTVLKGLDKVLANLRKEIKAQRLRTKEGLTEAGLVIKADAVRYAPIDWGNLRGSGFIMVTGVKAFEAPFTPMGNNPDTLAKLATGHVQAMAEAKRIVGDDQKHLVGIVGFTAYYAIWVHEMPKYYNFNQGSSKFLQRSLLKNKKRVLRILVKHARIR